MIILYIFLVLLVIFLIMPLRVDIDINYDRNSAKNFITDVNLIFIKFFNIKLDIDDLVARLVADEDRKFSISKLIYNIEYFIVSKNINKTLFKMIEADKVTAIGQFSNIYNYVAGNNIIYLGRRILKLYLKSINDEYYSLKYGNENKVVIKISMHGRLVYVFFTVIANFKDILKVRKFIKKRRKKVGTFN